MDTNLEFALARVGELYCELTSALRANKQLQAQLAEAQKPKEAPPSGEASGSV